MAPSKMSRTKIRRFSNQKQKEESPEENGGRSAKYERKRKLSDMLGYQWSKEELLQFYKAYRKYGKDFKKVAGVIPNRSQDMVEALYNMLKAYLSLPVREKSTAELISMMMDHQMTMNGSCSVQETNGSLAIFYKPQKRGETHIKSRSQRLDRMFPNIFQHNKPPEIQPHAVGKRTPRFPVRYSLGDECRNILTSKPDLDTIEINVNQVVVLALAESALRDRSSQVSCSPIKILEHIRASPYRRKVTGAGIDGEDYDVGIRKRDDEHADFAIHKEGIKPAEISQKDKEFNMKKQKVCSLGEMNKLSHRSTESFDLKNVKVKVETEDTNAKVWFPAAPSKSRRQKISKDESMALDALLELANLSEDNIPKYSNLHSESCVQVKKEIGSTNTNGKPITSVFTGSKRKKSKISETNESKSGVKSIPIQKDEGKGLLLCGKSKCKLKNHDFQSTRKLRKRRPIDAKIPNSECDRKSLLLAESLGMETEIPMFECDSKSLLEESMGMETEIPKLECDSKSLLAESLGMETEVCSMKHVEPPVKQNSRRKMHLKQALFQKVRSGVAVGTKPPEGNSSSVSYGAIDYKRMLSHCLSSPLLRRWCVFEFFYSAIDSPWFAKNEFVEYLNYTKLGGLPTRLTRAEWSLIRSALGKPRRLSEHFLQEERRKLHDYRENVRETYACLRAGIWDGLVDLAHPLSVEQRILVWHPMTRELHDGNVLTVDCNRCKVQFDQPDLGVELVMDIDCMCLNPLNIIPVPLGALNFATNKWRENLHGSKLEINCKDWKREDCKVFFFDKSLVEKEGPSNFDSTSCLLTSLAKQNEEASLTSAGKVKATVGEAATEKVDAGRIETIPLCDLFCTLEKQNSGFQSQEIGSHVSGILSSSIREARKMVSSEVISSLKEGQLSLLKIGELYISKDDHSRSGDPNFLEMRCSGPALDHGPCPPADWDHATSAQFEIGVPDDKLIASSNQDELHLPIELASTCIATLLMIQTCSDCKYPPGEVAQILDYAVTRLYPCCSHNLPLYRDVEQCMGSIKSQVLALVPTHSN